MNTKTISLTGSEVKVGFYGTNAWLRNDGTSTVYAGKQPNVVSGADGVVSVPAGGSAPVFDAHGTVYLTGTGSVLLIGSDYSENPFKSSAQSGGSGADEVARAAIEAHAGNSAVHLTAEQLDNAVSEVKSYADGKDAEMLTAAKAYADGLAMSGGDVTQSYVDGKDAETLAGAQSYADSAAQSAVTSANAYTEQYSAKAVHTHTVSDLTDFTAGVTEEQLTAAVDAKIDKIKTVSVMITTTGWLSDDDSKYPFYYDILAPEATAYDRADVRIMPDYIEAALTAGFDTKTDTREGYIRIRAKSAPTAVISAEYQIFGGAV
ncbi:MAG: hypothetical protein J6C38_01400 [Oscillospiraceae bacterium]|nr:hypothetical protein [Oscillospiraceae bacterium]